MKAKIVILGEFDPTREPRVATGIAIEHAAAEMGVDIDFSWIPTNEIDFGLLAKSNGIFIAPGSPYRDMEKVLSTISPDPRLYKSRCERRGTIPLTRAGLKGETRNRSVAYLAAYFISFAFSPFFP